MFFQIAIPGVVVLVAGVNNDMYNLFSNRYTRRRRRSQRRQMSRVVPKRRRAARRRVRRGRRRVPPPPRAPRPQPPPLGRAPQRGHLRPPQPQPRGAPHLHNTPHLRYTHTGLMGLVYLRQGYNVLALVMRLIWKFCPIAFILDAVWLFFRLRCQLKSTSHSPASRSTTSSASRRQDNSRQGNNKHNNKQRPLSPNRITTLGKRKRRFPRTRNKVPQNSSGSLFLP